MNAEGNALLRGGRNGDERLALALASGPAGAGSVGPMGLLLVGLLSLSCQSQPESLPHEQLSYHTRFKPGSPISAVVEVCGSPVCRLKSSPFEEVEYVSDSSANIKGYLLRTAAPDPPNVQKSQEIFNVTRQAVIVQLGGGESFLQTGDPSYWPTRDKETRVVTLTTEDDQHTVLAVGAVGPDSEKIPPDGKAHDAAEVATWWEKVSGLPASAPSGK